jgi:glycosyltransferase involved in cell wall biosynthesis
LAAGAPVIGFGKGGLLDTVQDGIHGVHFAVQSTDCIVAAVKKFLEFPRDHFHPDVLRLQAEKFSNARFRGRFRKLVEILEERFQKDGPAGVRGAIPESDLT